MVGLHSGTHSKLVVIGGIITIAIADSMSVALGIHMSQESDNTASKWDVWIATIVTFFSKMFMAITFILPVLIFELSIAVSVSVVWGLLVIAVLKLLASKESGRAHPICDG